jgi:hypothetical protein
VQRYLRLAFGALLLSAGRHVTGAATGPTAAVLRLEHAPRAGAKSLPPLVCWSEAWQTPRPVRFYVLRVDLRSPLYEVFTVVGDDPDGDGPAEAKLESPQALANRLNAVAAVNANAFAHLPTATPEERQQGWFAGKLVDVAGLVAADGALRSPPDSPLASLWLDRDGAPHVGDVPDPTQARQGVSSWIDRLLADGQVVARPETHLHPRTLVGVDAEAKVMLLVVADGRQQGNSEGISLPEAAAFMKQHGCHNATNLDGGGSSILLAQESDPDGVHLDMCIVNRPSAGAPRPIPVMLGVRLRAVPSTGP